MKELVLKIKKMIYGVKGEEKMPLTQAVLLREEKKKKLKEFRMYLLHEIGVIIQGLIIAVIFIATMIALYYGGK